jgi:hypothetical protein
VEISGGISPNFEKTLKPAQIDGELSSIDSKKKENGQLRSA